jgi:hypothetical protein
MKKFVNSDKAAKLSPINFDSKFNVDKKKKKNNLKASTSFSNFGKK